MPPFCLGESGLPGKSWIASSQGFLAITIDDDAPTTAVIPADAGIQYAASSRFNH
jgi:hypothetical protein